MRLDGRRRARRGGQRRGAGGDGGGPDGFWYYGTGSYVASEGNILRNRLGAGFLFWKSGARGEVSWTFCRVFNDPMDDFDQVGKKDFCLIYPASRNAWFRTIQWEGLREGIADYAYLHTLDTAIAAAAGSDNDRLRARAPQARAVLRQIVDETPWLSSEGEVNLDRLRWMAAQAILELGP